MPAQTPIQIEYPAIDDAIFKGNPVLRGVIAQNSLKDLRIDLAYQREFLSSSTRRYIMDALINRQRLPDIELGMRGDNWAFAANSSEIIILNDPVFIIDGQQRRGTTLDFLKNNPSAQIRQGALIHFNTSMEWERERFHNLNLHQTRVSSSVLLRNLRSTNAGISTLYGLTVTDKEFSLRDRVSWTQSRHQKDLISSRLYVGTILLLHGHMGSGIISSNVNAINVGILRLVEIIGIPTLRENTKTFWSIIDEVWNLTDLSQPGAAWTKSGFLTAIAELISDHKDFWDGDRLSIGKSQIAKLKRFPINDPQIKTLAGQASQGAKALQYLLVQHLNKGRHTLLDRRPDTTYEHRAQSAKAMGHRNKGKSNKERLTIVKPVKPMAAVLYPSKSHG